MIYWQTSTWVILTSILGPPELIAESLSRETNGCSARRVVLRRYIPFGATAWSFSDRGPWKPLKELPQEVRDLLVED